MREIFFSFIVSLLSWTIISCGQTTEEGVASVVSSANDAVNDTTGAIDDSLFGDTEDGSCPSVGTFQKNIYARQVKQTNDCGYIVAYREVLTKLDSSGATLWETKITLKQKKHSNLGKASVIQTSDGGYLYSDENGIAKLSSAGEIEWKKPISCELFPVRISEYPTFTAVNVQFLEICASACTLGKALEIPVYKFLKDPLIKRFGKEWYQEMEKVVDT